MTPRPSIPPPVAYGLPPKFSAWRPNQDVASIRAIQAPQRFSAIVAPTGFGKMAVAETIARYLGRSAYLTVNKGLQDQVMREVADRFDLRGKSNYECQLLAENGATGWQSRVDQADMLCDQCAYRDRSCEYYARHRRAKSERHLNTNYAKWLSTDEETFGSDFDVLVCDEAHGAPDQISASMRVELRARWLDEFCREPLPDYGRRSIAEWSRWGAGHLIRLQPKLDGLMIAVGGGQRSRMRELRDLRSLVRSLVRLSSVGDGWIEDRSGGDGSDRTAFEPVWPRAYGEALFRGVSKIVLLSATIRPKTLELMGIDPSRADLVDFAEYPSSFPVDRRPVVWVKTVQQRHGMSEEERLEAVRRADQLIDARLDRKGIIHTVSFERARHLIRHSRHSNRMMFNEPKDPDTRDTAKLVERFKRAPKGTVLVGPSFMEGWDFEGELAEWQNLMKVPLLNRKSSPVADARCSEDPDYDGYQAMDKVQQMAGRIVRTDKDRGETIITDDAWGNWFLRANRRHAAQWFLDAVVPGAVMLPAPPPKL